MILFLELARHYPLRFVAIILSSLVFPPFLIPLLAYAVYSFYQNRLKNWCRRTKVVSKKWRLPKAEEVEIVARDGVKLKYYVIKGKSDKVMFFCQPLGGHAFLAYSPIVHQYEGDWTFITWDYRGLYDSETPNRIRRISVPEQAQDAIHVLDHYGCTVPDVMFGYSMGVQVALEIAVLYPERVQSIILLNGAHGQVFNSAFQPLFRVPFVAGFARWLCGILVERPHLLEMVRVTMKPFLDNILPVYSRFFGSAHLNNVMGPTYMSDFLSQYLGDICRTPENARNWLWLFQELDAHSVTHLLRTIEHPTLIISGMLDCLTPAFQSFEMARMMKNARHCFDPWSSHAAIFENPELVLKQVADFISEGSSRYIRSNSTDFDASSTPKTKKTQ